MPLIEKMIIIYYIADLPVTRPRLLTNKSVNIAVPHASLPSLILLRSSLSFAFFSTRFYQARGMLDSVSHKKNSTTTNDVWVHRVFIFIKIVFHLCINGGTQVWKFNFINNSKLKRKITPVFFHFLFFIFHFFLFFIFYFLFFIFYFLFLILILRCTFK